MFTFIDGKDVGNLLVEAEYQAPIADHSWLGVVVSGDGAMFTGTGVRYYYGDSEAMVFPGLEFGAYRLKADHGLVDELTVLMGGGLVCEVNAPVGERVLPLVVSLGYYPSVSGADVSMIRFGVKVAPALFPDGGGE
jgi:hypothetical protein